MGSKAKISEALLHYIWRFRLYNSSDLKITSGETLVVEDVGHYHQNAGPDFEYARIRIGHTYWSGHVEIHVDEEDWLRHGHHQDASYNNVILHVVWEEGAKAIYRSDHTGIPTLVLQPITDGSLLDRYESLMRTTDWIPCAQQLPSVPTFTIQNYLYRLSIERLEQKANYIYTLLEANTQDWERTFLLVLGRAFGMKVNAEPFEVLCQRLDLQWLHKNNSNSHSVESMLFGLAGFLDEVHDPYTEGLKSEYEYLRHIHQWVSMHKMEWKFMRMRPYNFPTLRIGQLAALLAKKTYWFTYIQEVDSLFTLFDFLDSIEINSYWLNHFRFGVETKVHTVGFSQAFKVHLAINCFIPMLFTFGNQMKIESLKDKALDWLNKLAPEVNQTTKRFAYYKVKCFTASDSQALLHLKHNYCLPKRCLDCAIGLSILKT